MSDEGMFRPPGAPGSELRPSRPPGMPVPRQQAGPPAGDRRTGRRVSPETAWRLCGVAVAVAVYLAAGLPWYRIGVDQCVRDIGRNDSASLRAACEHVALSGWQASRWGILLALAAGVLMVVRLARRGPVLLDLLVPLAAGAAAVLAVRALFDPADRQLDLTWPGPLAVLPLLGALTVAGAQVYRLAHLSGVRSLGQAGARLRQQVGDRPLRLPGWLRPASMWRRRRRWLAGVGVVCVALVAHSCAQQAPLGGTPGVTGAQAGGGLDPGRTGPSDTPGASGPSGTARPTRPPDGAPLLAAARTTVAAVHAVEVTVHSLAGADVQVDLTMTSDRRADGTVSTNRNRYNVRRVGTRCWVQQLPGHPLLDWVPTCTIPASGGTPAIDLAALSDWQVMVAALPDPAGARVTTGAGGAVRRVVAADGTTVDVGTDPGLGTVPVRIHSPRPRPGGAVDVGYDNWDEQVTITPP